MTTTKQHPFDLKYYDNLPLPEKQLQCIQQVEYSSGKIAIREGEIIVAKTDEKWNMLFSFDSKGMLFSASASRFNVIN